MHPIQVVARIKIRPDVVDKVHIKAYREATQGMIIQRELNLLTQVR
jgi:hypothetical protein